MPANEAPLSPSINATTATSPATTETTTAAATNTNPSGAAANGVQDGGKAQTSSTSENAVQTMERPRSALLRPGQEEQEQAEREAHQTTHQLHDGYAAAESEQDHASCDHLLHDDHAALLDAADDLLAPGIQLQGSVNDMNDRVESYVMQTLDRIASGLDSDDEDPDGADAVRDSSSHSDNPDNLQFYQQHDNEQTDRDASSIRRQQEKRASKRSVPSGADSDSEWVMSPVGSDARDLSDMDAGFTPSASSSSEQFDQFVRRVQQGESTVDAFNQSQMPRSRRPSAAHLDRESEQARRLQKSMSTSSIGDRLIDKFSEIRDKGGDVRSAVRHLVAHEKERLQHLISKHRDRIRERQLELAHHQAKVKADFDRRRQAWEERVSKPPFLRLIDKICFTGFVASFLVTEFLLLRYPQWIWLWYAVCIIPLVGTRYVLYHREQWHYFLLDYCYFAQCLLLFYLFFYPTSGQLFELVFSSMNGPLAWSVITWHNSFVFHDLDKMTSSAIHLFPAIVTYSIRWYTPLEGQASVCSQDDCSIPSVWSWLSSPLVIYAIWQLSYFLKTEYVDHAKIAANVRLKTSYRWLSSSRGHISYRIMNKFDRRFWPTVYMGIQLLFTVLTILPTILFFQSFVMHTIFLLGLLLAALWNGANYYVTFLFERTRAQHAPPPAPIVPSVVSPPADVAGKEQ
ncbi:membrane transporter [Capsaspora owczarzaki ATCC 30864]|uniref:Glycerophosphocholine acyltransferase 1 n=1 Tax=Capsaspora owczarzaki (strain ATCC 30864) TaxID=595528 RepID=A0A0D2WPH1_CAPO3|nr:membrane transporter [Capsaspora owczarzaki ATCC 30864]KJE92553.1 membrane transporter [Capsaspora owczarzaki ATCC 30864]|eukprot:XP_004348404.1 membrane transporter [Capsaspora owczarzaki ATCC 30864]